MISASFCRSSNAVLTPDTYGVRMSDTETVDHEPAGRAVLGLAAAASAGAALVHAAAAGSHVGDDSLQLLFAVSAVLQLAWAALAVLAPRRPVVLAGVVLNAGAVAAWLLQRTIGLPVIDALREPEAVGLQDSLAALLGALAAVGAAASLIPAFGRHRRSPVWLAAGSVAALLLAVPAMAADHAAGGSHDHGHGDETAAHPQGDEAAAEDEHAHDASSGGEEGGTGGHDHEVPARLDHEPTDEQLDAARDLIDDTKAATSKYEDVAAAEAAGFRSIGDGRSGVEHFVHQGYNSDDESLDPDKPESLVYKVHPGGSRELTTVMYILPAGSTMDDVPDIAGNLTLWHDHDNLCFDDNGRIAGIARGGRCVPSGELVQTAPMLHVWVKPNDCGPFAGTDAAQMTGSCVQDLEI